jgi:hypothetical protein
MRWRRLTKIVGISAGMLAAAPFVLFALYYLFVVLQYHKAWLYNGDGIAYQGNRSDQLMTIWVGKIDLSRAGVARFSLSHIPYDGVWIGLELPNPVSTIPNADVRLTLTDNDGRVVLQEHGMLSSWNQVDRGHDLGESPQANAPRVLRREGASREITDAHGDTSYERLGVRIDSGWGTHFTPRFFTRYELQVKVEHPDPAYSRSVTVLVEAEPTMFMP